MSKTIKTEKLSHADYTIEGVASKPQFFKGDTEVDIEEINDESLKSRVQLREKHGFYFKE